jgi:hypothetical protein
MLNRGEIDFLIVNRDEGMTIEFGVEFDGHPRHRSPEGAAKDRVKDRICVQVGIPLVRIADEALGEHEQITVLEWIVDCFRILRTEPDRVRHAVALLNDYDETFEHPAGPVDAALALHTMNPFPATTAVQDRLRTRYGIETQRNGLPKVGDAVKDGIAEIVRWAEAPLKLLDLNQLERLFENEDEEEDWAADRGGWPNEYRLGLARTSAEVALLHIATVPIHWSPEDLSAQVQAAYSVGSWMWAVDVALAEYVAHADIERWAGRNLARLDRGHA